LPWKRSGLSRNQLVPVQATAHNTCKFYLAFRINSEKLYNDFACKSLGSLFNFQNSESYLRDTCTYIGKLWDAGKLDLVSPRRSNSINSKVVSNTLYCSFKRLAKLDIVLPLQAPDNWLGNVCSSNAKKSCPLGKTGHRGRSIRSCKVGAVQLWNSGRGKIFSCSQKQTLPSYHNQYRI
jgi:hypothetical protein